MATFGQNLVTLRERAGFKTARALADALGVAASVVSRWENDITGLPETPTMLRLAKVLRCTVEELIPAGLDEDYDSVRNKRQREYISEAISGGGDEVEIVPLSPDYQKRGLPVLYEGDASPQGLLWTQDGTPLFNVEEWGSRPVDVKDPQAYLVVIRGDSMEPAYKRGWRAIVSPNLHVSDGDLVCIHLTSGERLIKIAHRDRIQGGWQLQSHNPMYPPRFAPDGDVSMIHKVAYVRTMK